MIPPRVFPLAVLSALSVAVPLAAQNPDAPWDSVQVAWDAGAFPEALGRIDRLLAGADAARWLERAALLTGELYVTTELAPDGRQLRWSPGGRYVSWELGRDAYRRTVISRFTGVPSAERAAELPGYALTFAPGDGYAAYLTRAGTVRDVSIATLAERDIPSPGLRVCSLAYDADGTLLATTQNAADNSGFCPFSVDSVGRLRIPVTAADTATAIYGLGPASPRPALADSASAFVAADSGQNAIFVRRESGVAARLLYRTDRPLANAVLSPDGSLVAWQQMPREDWEIYVAPATGPATPRRLTREIQHDIFPQFLSEGRLLEVLGEGRHRRSYLLDVATGARQRLFHNNLLRTVSSEYQWAVSPDRGRILISADRDGNTVSPERGVYLTDVTRRVTLDDVRARVRAALAGERRLREMAARMFRPIAPRVRAAVSDVSVSRIDRYAHDLYSFDSKFITQPGNRLAIDYLEAQLRRFGYEPEVQWFEPRPGIRSANVIATLRGTVDPDVTYVAGSHFDSVEGSPGGDDDSSGSSALLETARVLASRPQRATIKLVFFTAEEAGLLGARHFVRLALADSLRVVGALNNDMIGWMNDHRLDNTIRYVNDGLRDLQHAAALEFTSLVTYDSRYYQSTDAHPLFDGYGDVVAGIGSYPILGNPHYHQTHDVLETIDQRLVAEVARTTVASLMLMASSPSRLKGLSVTWHGDAAVATWQRSVERGVPAYLVSYGPPGNPSARTLRTPSLRFELRGAQPGWQVAVKAVLPDGLEGWDWARGSVPGR